MATKITIQTELSKSFLPILSNLEALVSNDKTESDDWLIRNIDATKKLWGK